MYIELFATALDYSQMFLILKIFDIFKYDKVKNSFYFSRK